MNAGRRDRRRNCPRPAVVVLPDDGDPTDEEMPRTRGDCAGSPRPCPWVGCQWHLYLDAEAPRRPGAVRLLWPHLEPWDIPETCALDIADRGGATLEEVGSAINASRERVRQIQDAALAKIRRAWARAHR